MPRIRIVIGVSPDHAVAYTDEVEETIRTVAQDKTVCALGSCGIDRNAGKEQEHAFARQIALAKELALPLVVETRGAYDRALDFLLSEGMPDKGVVLRAGDATSEQLAKWADEGCYISLGPEGLDDPLSFYDRARMLPADRILFESGAPDERLDVLAGADPRCDQVVFVADILQGICPPIRLVENWLTLFT
ncbi:MAG: TatD family hydrolase [Eggerthellaceae bacterium]|nr:TatD family hydrolase [Eggerthellaceae bacterium]